ncbi:hypothetical protein GWK47_027533 [Chionoecetes opilio]|uniref:Uncharacterized protein n=1 Tax=Chionoecetes opilio TaxID=41210 RepID=A0A8J8WCB0_CHIOP|nr:hypothetical protein GWK47_027533 [Chionoecetes opilio]
MPGLFPAWGCKLSVSPTPGGTAPFNVKRVGTSTVVLRMPGVAKLLRGRDVAGLWLLAPLTTWILKFFSGNPVSARALQSSL